LGAYSIKLNREDDQMNIHFILQRSVNDFDYEGLDNDDISFGFDIKG